MKQITLEFLKDKNACIPGIVYVTRQFTFPISLDKMINHAITLNEKEKLHWANWLITGCMNKKQKVQYAIYAAEQVIHIFENKYPKDNRPRLAIEAAKAYLKRPCKKTKEKSYAAAFISYNVAACAAYATAYTAADCCTTAAVYNIAAICAIGAACAADIYNNQLISILQYGLTLFK